MNNFERIKDVKSVLVTDYCDNDLNPDISFVIPTFHRPETIGYAIESIVKQNGGAFLNYEIIIVDNSADFSKENATAAYIRELKGYPVRYFINEENVGPESNWNRGIELSRGKFVSMLHDDDVISCHYMQDIQVYLSTLPDIDRIPFIKINFLEFEDYNNLPKADETDFSVFRECTYVKALLSGGGDTSTPTCGMLFNKELVMRVGGFDDHYRPSGDHQLGVEFIKFHLIGYTATKVSGFYHVGINESMKFSTIQNFIRQDYNIRKDLYEMSFWGKLYGLFFEKAKYASWIDAWINAAAKSFGLSLKVEDLDFLHIYKKHRVKERMIRVMEIFYNRLINKKIKIKLTA